MDTITQNPTISPANSSYMIGLVLSLILGFVVPPILVILWCIYCRDKKTENEENNNDILQPIPYAPTTTSHFIADQNINPNNTLSSQTSIPIRISNNNPYEDY